jgi:cytochrome bd ubiquinol oxidase subunit II
METLWFSLVAVMIAIYVVLDGFDLGAGALHLLLAKTDAERRAVLASIGPVWGGNEVWLIAAGGTLYFAFPGLYASSFSGFYLPLMMVLGLLILRGISVEFRNHIENRVWAPLWGAIFCGATLLLAIFFGTALGNLMRGVPLDASGSFFLPLWTDFFRGDRRGHSGLIHAAHCPGGPAYTCRARRAADCLQSFRRSGAPRAADGGRTLVGACWPPPL